ncbi:hypothetical protein [Caballeronia grimmiae]|uniref:hypothetical protein n=1 Tax=Caballeronia grimmiae TaxID=1071679 RepID=UPI0038BB786C
MNRKLFATVFFIVSSAFAGSALASGYGPAPFYRPAVGAPSSQQGPSAQTIAAEETAHASDAYSFGSSPDTQTQSSVRRVEGASNATSSSVDN